MGKLQVRRYWDLGQGVCGTPGVLREKVSRQQCWNWISMGHASSWPSAVSLVETLVVDLGAELRS